MSVTELKEKFKRKPETAEFFCQSVRTVERWMVEGCPHSHILGKAVFRPVEVERWLEDHGKLKRRGDQT